MNVDKTETRKILRRLCEAHAPSGFEGEARNILIDEPRSFVNSLEVDALGNLIAYKEGVGKDCPKILLCSHMDEVSLIVQYIDSEGFIHPEINGWIDASSLPAHTVIIHGRNGMVEGVVGARSGHFKSLEKAKRVEIKDLWIDIGAESDVKVREMGVEVGDPITYKSSFTILKDDRVASKSLDDRVGCTALIQLMRMVNQNPIECSIYAVGSVQEEVGSRGIRTAAATINPDLALILDTVPAVDPSTETHETTSKIGFGPVIRMMDTIWSSMLGTITPRIIRDLLIEASEEENIKIQRDVMRTWTDATVHTVGKGIPSGSVLIPRRYAHSPTEICDLNDLMSTVRLVYRAISNIDKSFLSKIRFRIK